jgi:antitoxin CptB
MPAPPPAVDPQELGKLRWRCRRGMKELDVLLSRYVEERFCDASNAEQDLFRQLLETQDPLLYAYCLGSERPPPRFVNLIGQITANSPAGDEPAGSDKSAADR